MSNIHVESAGLPQAISVPSKASAFAETPRGESQRQPLASISICFAQAFERPIQTLKQVGADGPLHGQKRVVREEMAAAQLPSESSTNSVQTTGFGKC